MPGEQVSSGMLVSEETKSFLRSVSLTKKSIKNGKTKLIKQPSHVIAALRYQHMGVSEAQNTLLPLSLQCLGSTHQYVM